MIGLSCFHTCFSACNNVFPEKFWHIRKKVYLCTRKTKKGNGAIAQLVEQRTENPCVPGSIPGGTTIPKSLHHIRVGAIAQLVEQRTENPCVPGSIPGGTTQENR